MASPEIETRLFIDGEFVPSIDGAKFDVINPYSGDVVAQVYEGRANDVDRAVKSAKKAFPSWSELDGRYMANLHSTTLCAGADHYRCHQDPNVAVSCCAWLI